MVGPGLAREQCLHADQGEADDYVPEGECVRHVRKGFEV